MNKIFNKHKSTGFTLIELMIAISVIAVLAVVGFSSFTQAQMRGRDAKRKQDLRSIAIALDLYKRTNGHYPCNNVNGAWVFSPTTQQNWISDVAACSVVSTDQTLQPNYINSMPIDPLKNGTNTYADGNNGYGYYSNNGVFVNCAKGEHYVLVTQLENPSDPDALAKKTGQTVTYCGATFSPPTWGLNSFIVTPQ